MPVQIIQYPVFWGDVHDGDCILIPEFACINYVSSYKSNIKCVCDALQ